MLEELLMLKGSKVNEKLEELEKLVHKSVLLDKIFSEIFFYKNKFKEIL